MSISAAFVLYAVAWFMIFMLILPLRLKTQGDVGKIVPGTQASAPADDQGPSLKRKALIATLVAFAVWVLLYLTITQGWITVRDFDVMNRMPPLTEGDPR